MGIWAKIARSGEAPSVKIARPQRVKVSLAFFLFHLLLFILFLCLKITMSPKIFAIYWNFFL